MAGSARYVAESLQASGTPFLVIEDTDSRIAELRGSGIEAVFGNAASAGMLAYANVEGAHSLVVAIPNAFEACGVTQQARAINPSLLIVARAHSDAEVDMKAYGADTVIMGEREIALGMVDQLTQLHHERAQ